MVTVKVDIFHFFVQILRTLSLANIYIFLKYKSEV